VYGQQPYLVPAHPPIEGCGAGVGVGLGVGVGVGGGTGTGTGVGLVTTIMWPVRTIAKMIIRSAIIIISNKSIYIKPI